MSEREIARLRKKIVIVSTFSFSLIMLLIGGFIYLFSELTLRNEVHQIMDFIIQNDGEMPTMEDEEESRPAERESEAADSFDENMRWGLENFFGYGDVIYDNPGFLQTTRYFAVLFTEGGALEEVRTNLVSDIDEEQAERYGRIAMRRLFKFGNFGRYYYGVSRRNAGGTIVIYLDRTGQISINNRILFAVLVLLGFGTVLAFFLMRSFAVKLVRPEVEAAERQKQFITNASHELKTPLAVIRANTEMLEILEGENEWTASTMRQVERMDGLIQNLVRIARAREKEREELQVIDVSAPIRETAESFSPVAAGAGKSLTCQVPEGIAMLADESSVRQLAGLLVDNAVKYCDEGGEISVRLERASRTVTLSVSNDFAAGKDVDYTRFFERFYRQDGARNQEKSGYGIGLSIAESVVKELGGRIGASWKDGKIAFACSFRAVGR